MAVALDGIEPRTLEGGTGLMQSVSVIPTGERVGMLRVQGEVIDQDTGNARIFRGMWLRRPGAPFEEWLRVDPQGEAFTAIAAMYLPPSARASDVSDMTFFVRDGNRDPQTLMQVNDGAPIEI